MSEDYNQRFVNVGFSGGEKKRNEILSMLLLKPDLIILVLITDRFKRQIVF